MGGVNRKKKTTNNLHNKTICFNFDTVKTFKLNNFKNHGN